VAGRVVVYSAAVPIAARASVVATGRGPFLERGYTATTIDEIAAAAGVSKQTVLTAVGNKA